jgi:hypothetical protein
MPTWLTIEAPPQKKAKVTVTPAGGGMVAVKMKAAPGQDLRGVLASPLVLTEGKPAIGMVDSSSKAEAAAQPKPKRTAWTGVKEPEKKVEPPKLDPANPYSMGVEKLVWEKDERGNRVGGHFEPVTDEEYLNR